MPLPGQIAVRISSEAAGAITMTPVVTRELPLREVVEIILATTGKDAPRVAEVLHRGAVVQGASRFRWNPLEVSPGDLATLLAQFPERDPGRVFRADHCTLIRLRSARQTVEIPREAAARRRFLKRRSFWDVLVDLCAQCGPEYVDYSYRNRADEYRIALSTTALETVREGARLLKYPHLAQQVRTLPFASIEFLVSLPAERSRQE